MGGPNAQHVFCKGIAVGLLRLIRLLNCVTESLLPKRSLPSGGLDYRLALVVEDSHVSTMLNKKGYCAIINGSEDWGFTIVITRIHVSPSFNNSSSTSVRNVSWSGVFLVITCTYIGSGFS